MKRILLRNEDIACGKRGSARECPVALAIIREHNFKNLFQTVSIGLGKIQILSKKYIPTKKLAEIINEFDVHGRIEPFYLVLDDERQTADAELISIPIEPGQMNIFDYAASISGQREITKDAVRS